MIDFTTFIQAGTITGTVASGNTIVTIDFPNQFSGTDYQVFLQFNTSGNYAALHPAVILTERYTDKVKINMYATAGTDYSMSWLAIKV